MDGIVNVECEATLSLTIRGANGQDEVIVDSDPLIGMGFLYGYEIRIQVIEGGRVVAEKLSGC